MAKKNLTPEELGMIRLIEEGSKSLKDYNDLLAKTRDLSQNIEHVDIHRAALQEKIKKLEAETLALKKLGFTTSSDEVKTLELEIAGLKHGKSLADDTLVTAREELKIHQQAVKAINVKVLALKDAGRALKNMGKSIYDQKGWLYEQQKSVKETELSMGILSNQAKGFRQNIYKTSLSTTQIGIDTKDLAKIQGTYSDNIGRSVQLSEEQLIAMSQLAKGTSLGVEGAAEFAANMENFGISAKGSVELVNTMLKTSHKMGVNSGKVIKNIQKNMSIANKYHFKGGMEGMAKMAALSTKFKLEMSAVAGFAEKLITPEGAIEAAAQLQVLGGEWAKLGDPFQLMFKARNDMEGLTKDLIKATTSTAKFNKITGEIDIDPMELHRLREVANATGIEFEQLATTAREVAKNDFISGKVSGGGIFKKEDREYIASLAQFNKTTGAYEVTLQKEDGSSVTENISKLQTITSKMIENQKEYTQNLETNAKQSLTFDETLDNLKNTFKSVLLPGFEVFTKALQEGLGNFTDWAKDKQVFEKLASFGKMIGEFGAVLIKFAVENPIATGIGLLVGKAAVWYARGISLGMGFNSVASTGGSSPWSPGKKGSVGGQLKAGGKMGSMMGGKMGAGAGALTGLMAGYGEWTENSEAGMDSGENMGRTALVGGGGIAGGALAGAAMGALGGPLAPVTVPLGALIGGALGAWGGDALGDMAYGESNGKATGKFDDFISRPGENPISFSSKDSLIGAKKDGPIDKMINNQSSKSSENGNVIVEFNKPLRIEGKLELSSNGKSIDLDLDNPILMRDLSKIIQEQLSKAIGGGKISSNPVMS